MAPTAPATLPTKLGDSKGSASRSRAGASTRLLRLYVPERYLHGGERKIPGVRQMVNLGLPTSGESSKELTDEPAVADGNQGGLEVVLVVMEALEEDRDVLLPIEDESIELAPYRLLQCWVALRSKFLLEGSSQLDRIRRTLDEGFSSGGERGANDSRRHAHLLLVAFDVGGVVRVELAILNLGCSSVCWVQVGLIGQGVLVGDDFPAPLSRHLYLDGAGPDGVVGLGQERAAVSSLSVAPFICGHSDGVFHICGVAQ